MDIEQRRWTRTHGWSEPAGGSRQAVDLVLAFAGKSVLLDSEPLAGLRRDYPDALLAGCSTAGEIAGTQVTDDSMVATAIAFANTRVRGAELGLEEVKGGYEAGRRLAEALAGEDLVHVLVLSDGLRINGSELTLGLNDHLPAGIQVTGGLAGDGDRFEDTLVFLGARPNTARVAAVGLYGKRLHVGFGSLGGWDPFGPERLITRSAGNVLFELDGRSALALYKKYLGDYAAGLPASALLFPLSLRPPDDRDHPVVRTILSTDDQAETMTFAGDMPRGHYARFMKANFERLIDGATSAAKASYEAVGSKPPELALLISCVGRRMVLKQRTEEEVESVREILGEDAVLAGFYSYGEISPFTKTARCELHNQTMTITTLSER